MNKEKYFAPIIGPIRFLNLNLYYQEIENSSELVKRLELRKLNPMLELPHLINRGIKINYLLKGTFALYHQDEGIILVLGKPDLKEMMIDDFNVLLSDPKPVSGDLYNKLLSLFLINYLYWRLERSPHVIMRVGDALYFDELVIGESKEGLSFTLMKGFSLRAMHHKSGTYIYVLNKFLPRIKPTLDKILSIDVFKGTFEYIRGEYFWDGLFKDMSAITIEDYFKLGKPSYAGRIHAVIYSDSEIYDDYKSLIVKYYESEREEVKRFMMSKLRENAPIVLTYKRKKTNLLSYSSNILYLAPTQDELKKILTILGFRHIMKWYIEAIHQDIKEYLNDVNNWLTMIKEALIDLPVRTQIKFIEFY